MDRKLTVQLETRKTVKDAQGNDVTFPFVMILPYMAPYALAYEAISDFEKDIQDMNRADVERLAAAEKKDEAQEPQVVENT